MKILLIDDHKLIKIGIKVLLEDNEEFSVIDDCSSKKEFLEKITNDSYDLFICDISLPDGTGYDILEVIKEKNINTKVIILSMHEDKSYMKKAFKLGASIGEKLFLSVKTVDTYKKRLMEKTNTKKRSELVEYLKSNLIL